MHSKRENEMCGFAEVRGGYEYNKMCSSRSQNTIPNPTFFRDLTHVILYAPSNEKLKTPKIVSQRLTASTKFTIVYNRFGEWYCCLLYMYLAVNEIGGIGTPPRECRIVTNESGFFFTKRDW